MLSAVAYAGQAESRLSIDVVEGQNAINNVSRMSAFEPVIEVRDRTGKAVEGASVSFTLPSVGPGGAFADGSKTLMIHTDATGRATAKGLRPNKLTGRFDIHVRATYEGDAASAVVTQTNAAPTVAGHSSAKKWAILIGVVGGAAAATAVAAGGGGGSSARTTGNTTTPPGTVTPGAPGFGPPQ